MQKNSEEGIKTKKYVLVPKKQKFISEHMYNSVHWKILFFKGTRKIRPCLTGHPVS